MHFIVGEYDQHGKSSFVEEVIVRFTVTLKTNAELKACERCCRLQVRKSVVLPREERTGKDRRGVGGLDDSDVEFPLLPKSQDGPHVTPSVTFRGEFECQESLSGNSAATT